MTTFVLTTGKQLSQQTLTNLTEQFKAWDADGRQTPVVLQDGMQMSVLGGLTVRLALSGGPLDGVMLGLSVASLDDLPESLTFESGVYQPYRRNHDTGDVDWSGVWVKTTDGNPVYAWWTA